jgi:hypothetical protein
LHKPLYSCNLAPASPEISHTLWQKAASFGITEFPDNS